MRTILTPPDILPAHFGRLSAAELASIGRHELALRNGSTYQAEQWSINWDHVFHPNTATTNLYFYSLHYVGSLVAEYKESGIREFLEIAVKITRSFLTYIQSKEKNEIVFSNRGGGSVDHGVCIRVTSLLSILKEYLNAYKADETVSRLVDHIVECGKWLYKDENHAPNNHGLMVDVALALVGTSLDNDEGAEYIKKADERLSLLVQQTFDKDGLANENTIGYHRYNLIKYKEAVNLFIAWGLNDANYLKICGPIIDRAVTALSICCWQDGTTPPIGDWPVHPVSTPSINKSQCFSDSGFAVIKSDDLYVSIICGHRNPAHKHVDDTSISIRFKGIDICIDAGNYNFDRTSPYRRCLESSFGHSGVFISQVDGLLTADYLKLMPSGRFVKWSENNSGVQMKVELNLNSLNATLIREIEVIWPSTIIVKDTVNFDSPSEGIARQGWVIGQELARSFLQQPTNQIAFETDTITAFFTFDSPSQDEWVTFNRGALSPLPRGWRSIKDNEVEEALEISRYDKGRTIRFVTTINLTTNEMQQRKTANQVHT